MSYARNFKHDHLVVFDGDHFLYQNKIHIIHGVCGFDPDTNEIQIRDDTWVNGPDGKPFSFDRICAEWEAISKALVTLLKI
jgi:hypothetical protein